MPGLRSRGRCGAAYTKYLILIIVVGLMGAYWWWVSYHGLIGHVSDLPGSTADHIAFVRQDGTATNIYVIAADGSDLRQLTDDRSAKRSPSWAPDGKVICYAGEPMNSPAEGRSFQIFLLGGGPPRMATYGSIGKDSPQFRPDGKKIAFLSGGAIKVMDSTGANARQIYPPPRKGTTTDQDSPEGTSPPDLSQLKLPPVSQFRWSGDGRWIAAVLVVEGESMLAEGRPQWWRKEGQGSSAGDAPSGVLEPENVALLAGTEGGDPIPLQGAGANHAGMAWYPDSLHLAVSLNTSRRTHGIAVFRTDDPRGNAEGIYQSIGYTVAPENPAVSPDGSEVAFELWRMEGPENRELLGVAVLSAKPRQARDLIRIASKADLPKIPLVIKGEAHSPQWSPDGSRLLYWTYGKNGRDLWVCRADGSDPVNLTKGAGDNFDAVWSPAKR